jgi:hypothetical protein
MPFAGFLEMLNDPSVNLTISATPGAAPVRDMVRRIQEPVGK